MGSRILGSLFVLSFLLFFACKHKDNTENPCENVLPTKAQIRIEEKVGEKWFLGDTIAMFNNVVRFSSDFDADEYTWRLGSEIIKSKTFTKKFFPSGWLNVSLAVKRKPNSLCYPNDNGYDSIYKKFYVWPSYQDVNGGPPVAPYFPIYGTYRGHLLSDNTKEFNVTLFDTAWKDEIGRPAYIEVISGIPYPTRSNLGSSRASFTDYLKSLSPKALYLEFPDGGLGAYVNNKLIPWLPGMNGYAYFVDGNVNKIKIDFNYNDTISFKVPFPYSNSFVGYRIY